MADTLTIAIPFYKGLHYLRRAIESVLRQSSPAWRLIVCDDGAEPGTAELVAAFADPRICYLKNERNLGMAGNWNRCLDAADTDLVNLLHNDDELLPNYVAEMLAADREFPDAAAFFCKATVIDADGRECFSLVDFVKRFLEPKSKGPLVLHGKSAIEALMHGDFIMCPTVCYRRSRLPAERFQPEWRQVLDLDFFTRILLAGGTMVGLPATAYAYRRHAANATSENTENLLRFDEESRLHDRIAATARERGWPTVARVAAGKRVIKLHLLFRIAQDLCRLRLSAALQKWQFLRGLSRQSGNKTLSRGIPFVSPEETPPPCAT
ncbi:MAG TPA: glycosyltransferase family 2 protein [Gemmataceae bacterium]|jgi:glycosyltransferase involved in cell wall biosynthesis|nr:glycosyltransferase family 2 protein [Gemmataceae bacterium]